jgi:uncharacterized protein YacL (UPF0231 family)
MTPDIRFYRDQSRRPRVQATPEHAPFANYLESDLQDNAIISEVMQTLEQFSGDSEQEISGNSYTLILTPDKVTLENMFDEMEEPYQLSISKCIILLKAWADFIENGKLLSLVPETAC